MNKPDWLWNEMQQVGTDYNDLSEVEAYDKRMETFRDIDAENREMLSILELPGNANVLEIGCGTGRFSRSAAAAGMRATAIDVSKIMLDYVRQKVEEESLPAIETQNAGFLTMDLPENGFDAVVSGAALHHLPDAWKFVALLNIARLLKPGGRFILRDVVFSLNEKESPEMCFERFVSGFPQMRKEAARHVASEYSTYDWIMEGLLTRAGFDIISTDHPGDSFIVYNCRKSQSG